MSQTITLPKLDASVEERTVFLAATVVAAQAALVWTYVTVTGDTVTEPRYILYSWVWVDASLLAVWHADPSPTTRRHRLLGAAVAVAYFLLVMYLPGNFGFTGDGSGIVGLRFAWAIPAWGPILAYNSHWLRLYLLPFEVIGYAALSYLVYANTLKAARAVIPGALGLVTCVGCTVPVISAVGVVIGGSASGLAAAAYRWSYDVGTLFFLGALGLLYAASCR